MARQDQRFDAFRLAGAHGSIEGGVDPSTLGRLADRVAGEGGHIDWKIAGTADEQGRPALTVEIAGSVRLTCQRCLGTMDQPVEQVTRVLIARDDAELVRLDESTDEEVVLARGALDPLELVEEELLLTLPFAPRHDDACAAHGA